jgi:hypothetical protein
VPGVTTRGLELRPPRWAIAYLAAVTAVWCVLALVLLTLAEQPVSAAGPAVMVLLGGILTYRVSRLAVLERGDELVVHNLWHSQVLSRGEVEGFRLVRDRVGNSGVKVHAAVRGGDPVPLHATTESSRLRGAEARLQERMDQLERWRAGA